MRRAYDYWQNQPDCFLPRERHPTPLIQQRRRGFAPLQTLRLPCIEVAASALFRLLNREVCPKESTVQTAILGTPSYLRSPMTTSHQSTDSKVLPSRPRRRRVRPAVGEESYARDAATTSFSHSETSKLSTSLHAPANRCSLSRLLAGSVACDFRNTSEDNSP